MSKSLKSSIVLSILFIGLIRFIPIWERKPGGFWNLLFFIGIAVLFFWLSIKIIIEIVRIIKVRKELSFMVFAPILVLTIGITDGVFNPFRIDLDSIYGKTVFQACYEGTQNQATLKFRDNGKFDIHWTGVFFSDNFYTGKYSKKEDSIFMNFDTKMPNMLGDTLIIKEESLFKLNSDTLRSTGFYLGYCKGLN